MPVIIPGQPLTVSNFGDGVILDGNGLTVPSIDFRGATGCTVQNLNVVSAGSGTGVSFAGGRQNALESVVVQGFPIGISGPGPDTFIFNCIVGQCQIGISIAGRAWVVQNTDITDLRGRGLGDSDYIRIEGADHLIQECRLFGSDIIALEKKGFHVDGFQSFTQGGRRAERVTIKDCIIRDFHQGILVQDRMAGDKAAIRDWTIVGNVFLNGRGWAIGVEGDINFKIEGNIFARISPQGIGSRFGADVSVTSCIFADMPVGVWADDKSSRPASFNAYLNVRQNRAGSEFGSPDSSQLDFGVMPQSLNPSRDMISIKRDLKLSGIGPDWLYGMSPPPPPGPPPQPPPEPDPVPEPPPDPHDPDPPADPPGGHDPPPTHEPDPGQPAGLINMTVEEAKEMAASLSIAKTLTATSRDILMDKIEKIEQ